MAGRLRGDPFPLLLLLVQVGGFRGGQKGLGWRGRWSFRTYVVVVPQVVLRCRQENCQEAAAPVHTIWRGIVYTHHIAGHCTYHSYIPKTVQGHIQEDQILGTSCPVVPTLLLSPSCELLPLRTPRHGPEMVGNKASS